MDKDLTMLYGILSAVIGSVFGVEMGVFFCALGGAMLSLRFTETKTTTMKAIEVGIGTLLTCLAIASVIDLELITSPALLKFTAILLGAVILIVFDSLGKGLKKIDLGEKFNALIDKVTDKWTR